MKMDLITLVIIIATSLGGGYYGGRKKAQREGEREKIEFQERINSLEQDGIARVKRLQHSIDSLQGLPANVDPVITVVTKVERNTDTLILLSKDILINTDTIKRDLKQLIDATIIKN